MDESRFDRLARKFAKGHSRRSVVKGLLGGLAALAGRGLAEAKPSCREAGHPCEGNQTCCVGLVCVVSGPGSARRCTPCPTGQIACGRVCIAACAATDQCHLNGTCDPATGQCTNPPAPVNTPCGNGRVCDGSGSCVECLRATVCPGQDTECQARTCTSGKCGVTNAPAGTPTSNQTAGDCQKNVCDGAGGVTSTADNSDVPADDGNPCTTEVCSNGTPAHPAKPDGTACAPPGGGTGECQGGSCVTCLALHDMTCTADDQCCGHATGTVCAPEDECTGGNPAGTQCCRSEGAGCSSSCDCCGDMLCDETGHCS
jgi:hypothetical protein